MPCKVDLCSCELGIPAFVLLAFPNYCLILDFFLIGDIYINYGASLLEFEISSDVLTEKAVHLLMQQRCKNGSPFVSLESDISGKVEVGTKKDQQENSTACTARDSDVQSLKGIKNY